MGLDTSHGCWHGAYSAFMRWRMKIAEVAGVPLMLMDGFYESPDAGLVARTQPRREVFSQSGSGAFVATRDSLMAGLADAADRGDAGRWESWASKLTPFLPIHWDTLVPDPIHALLNHSDCEGNIPADSCGPLADRLEGLLPLLPDEDAGGHIGFWKEKTQTFIAGLRAAAKAGQAVDFH